MHQGDQQHNQDAKIRDLTFQPSYRAYQDMGFDMFPC